MRSNFLVTWSYPYSSDETSQDFHILTFRPVDEGTTSFIILGVGFGSGLMMAKSALEEPTGYRSGTSSEPLPPARVILPSTTEAALPPQTLKEQRAVTASPESAPQPQVQPVKEVKQAPVEQQLIRLIREKRRSANGESALL